MNHDRAILRLPQVLALVGLSRSTLYHFIKLGMFPPPVKLGQRASGWLSDEIDEWVAERCRRTPSAYVSRHMTAS